ncbi:MAG: hypothetical protein UIH18_02725, partial [Fibrobacteraceae bacterium]|nr:hypothetical protein [Fibrobacteraceae bacterium]
HATSVARGRLTFRLRGKIFSLHRNDKNCGQVQGCHGEESFKTTWPSVGKQIASVTTFHRNDKNCDKCEKIIRVRRHEITQAARPAHDLLFFFCLMRGERLGKN